ncbi:hypothetical protein BKA70DRAFT_1242012 [Coprinopsis sp. MPI-PUGE-AT-0042]|nr:hypothetical protein BKA70DRAFT_1242012 [Coprinopsis sp. MPI-PUGE-AT-0042]
MYNIRMFVHIILRQLYLPLLAILASYHLLSTRKANSTPTSPTPNNCKGLAFEWPLGSPQTSYPFAIHRDSSPFKPGYNLASWEVSSSIIWAQSFQCRGSIEADATSCPACQSVECLLPRVLKHAQKNPSLLDRSTLSHDQLLTRLAGAEDRLCKAKCDLLNLLEKDKRSQEKKEVWNEIYTFIGNNDIPGLPRIFQNGISLGWGSSMLLERLKAAHGGTYRPCNYTDAEKKIAALIYVISGKAALHALHKSVFAFPSRNTIMHLIHNYQLKITVGEPKMLDIIHNINTVFGNPLPGQKKAPVTISIDEIACDSRMCWLADTDEIAGLCEHTRELLPSLRMGEDLTVARILHKGLKEKVIHMGHEISVITAHRNDKTNYGAHILQIRVTSCLEIEMVRQCWTLAQCGERLIGPLIDLSSDGDPKRQPALYLHCMIKQLDPSEPLFKHLTTLNGLNLFTGPNGMVQDLDFKHIFKHKFFLHIQGVCKLLCLPKGILINNVTANKALIALWLERLTHVDWSDSPILSLFEPEDDVIEERIDSLLSPKDAQDVPWAVRLLTLTSNIRNLDDTEFDPAELKTHSALSVLGEMLNALVKPFVDPSYSLSQQIISLVKLGHLAAALFIKHESDFMPAHLYGDIQCMICAAVFRVAHILVMDPEHEVFLCLLGDDMLKILFGRVRMIGGHDPNVDVSVFRHRAGAAMFLDHIFQELPHLEMKASRLKMSRSRDADKLCPHLWEGNLKASDCNLDRCWKEGQRLAEEVLSQHGLLVDFTTIFEKPGFDLMRPKGGKYPGVALEALKDEIEAQKKAGNKPHSMWMDLGNGTLGHKKTILRLLMDPTLDVDSSRSHDRLLRVRYFSIGGDKRDRPSKPELIRLSNIPHLNLFQPSSLYAMFICVQKEVVSLAILQCTSIRLGTVYTKRARLDEISLPNSKYEVTGQILLLQLCMKGQQPCWYWDGNYVALDPATTPRKTATLHLNRSRHLSFTINGAATFPLAHSQLESIPFDEPGIEHADLERTWLFPDAEFAQIQDHLQQQIWQHDHLRSHIPVHGNIRDGNFPYQWNNNTNGKAFVIVFWYTSIF